MDQDSFKRFPTPVDQSVYQVLQMGWMMLPNDKHNVDELERQFRRTVDRELKDMRENDQGFVKS